jgi:hypothetical protein
MKSALKLNQLFYILLAIALWKVQGHYSAFFIVTITFLFFWKIRSEKQLLSSHPVEDLLLVCLFISSFLIWPFRPAVMYAPDTTELELLLKITSILLFLTTLLIWRIRSATKIVLSFCLLSALALFLVKIAVLRASPSPRIDVFTTTTDAIQHFLKGENPYAQNYTDINDGKFGYLPTFGYWPGLLLGATPGWLLFKDFRTSYIFADLITTFFLFTYARLLALPLLTCVLLPLLWLAFPVSPFVLEQAWTESLLCLVMGGIAITVFQRRWILFGVLVGLFCATKQYGLFLGLLSALYCVRQGTDAFKRFIAGAVASFGFLMAPFFFWNVSAFTASTVTVLLDMKLRTDQTSIPALIFHTFHYSTPGWILSLINVLGFTAICTWFLRRRATPLVFLQALVWAYGMTFIFGKMASCNYYFFLAFLTLLLIMTRLAPTALQD